MADAVESTPSSGSSSKPLGLVAASVIGALFVIAAAALVLRFIPLIWDNGVHKALTSATNSFVSGAVQVVVQVGIMIGLALVGTKLVKGLPIPGLRGGIFFMISVAFVAFFCGRAVYLIAGRGFSAGGIFQLILNGVMLALVFQFFRTGRFVRWSEIVDDGGWLSTESFKRTQGLRVRRLTMLGIMLVGITGVWSLVEHNYLPRNTEVRLENGEVVSSRLGDWVIGGELLSPRTIPTIKPNLEPEARLKIDAEREKIRLENQGRPRIEGGVTILPDLQFTLPLVFLAATVWFAWRLTNYPQFTDFLIATEAEINKVSWSTRKALIRDTMVVLVSLVMLTLFLFVVDVFWNFTLSNIGVLPSPKELQEAGIQKGKDPESVNYW